MSISQVNTGEYYASNRCTVVCFGFGVICISGGAVLDKLHGSSPVSGALYLIGSISILFSLVIACIANVRNSDKKRHPDAV